MVDYHNLQESAREVVKRQYSVQGWSDVAARVAEYDGFYSPTL